MSSILQAAMGAAGTGKQTKSAISADRLAVLFGRLRLLVFAALALPAFAAAQTNPRLESLHIQIWPEFDRRAALIILNGELAPDTPLPANVSLHLPASSGGPSAVAFANAPDSQLFNLQHKVTKTGEYSTLQFSVPQRFFHVEYYDDALATGSPQRTYTYVWPGDLAVDRLKVTLQEPAGANDVSTLPDLGARTAGGDGLHYRTLDLGAYEAGKQLPVAIRYTKPDSRPSAEILKLKTSATEPPGPTASTVSYPVWVPLAATMLGISASIPALWWVWRRRRAARGGKAAVAGFCSRCGNALGPGDRYCSSCGARAQRA